MNSSHNYQLTKTSSVIFDLIRIIAIHNIVIVHGITAMKISIPISPGLIGSLSFPFLFLISGFLIGYSIFGKMKQRHYDFATFLINRTARILPPLIVGLSVAAVLDGIWAFLNGIDIPSETYNIPTFILNLLFVNDSALGVPCFGVSFQLWTLPKFWWMYMMFGWCVLGLRTVKRKASYFLILGAFAFVILIIYCGPWYKKDLSGNIALLFTWVCGVFLVIMIARLDLFLKAKFPARNDMDRGIGNYGPSIEPLDSARVNFALNPRNYLILSSFLILFFLTSIFFFITLIEYLLFLILAFLFLLLWAQFTSFQFPPKIRKITSFLAGYSYSLYILHFSILNFMTLFFPWINNILLFLISYFFCNLFSIGIAAVSEKQYRRINSYLINNFMSKKKEISKNI
ncbi:MAG: membrane protein of unknown function [Promethearchaeota archaeon]|nr:MAG: membrane protein of unknown function [Candidatus Lokiarchaeota archaeon]